MMFDGLVALTVGAAAMYLADGQSSPLSSGRMHSLSAGLSVTQMAQCVVWFLVALLAVAWHYGLYSQLRVCDGWNEQRLSLQACIAAGLLLCGGLYLSSASAVPRRAVAIMVMLTAVCAAFRRAGSRYRRYRRYRKGIGIRNLLIAGENRLSEALRAQVETIPELGYRFRGFLLVPGATGDRCCPRKDIVGTLEDISAVARRASVGEIVITECCDSEQILRAVESARQLDIDLRILPGICDGVSLHGPIRYLGAVPLMSLHRRRPRKLSEQFSRYVEHWKSERSAASRIVSRTASQSRTHSPGRP